MVPTVALPKVGVQGGSNNASWCYSPVAVLVIRRSYHLCCCVFAYLVYSRYLNFVVPLTPDFSTWPASSASSAQLVLSFCLLPISSPFPCPLSCLVTASPSVAFAYSLLLHHSSTSNLSDDVIGHVS